MGGKYAKPLRFQFCQHLTIYIIQYKQINCIGDWTAVSLWPYRAVTVKQAWVKICCLFIPCICRNTLLTLLQSWCCLACLKGNLRCDVQGVFAVHKGLGILCRLQTVLHSHAVMIWDSKGKRNPSFEIFWYCFSVFLFENLLLIEIILRISVNAWKAYQSRKSLNVAGVVTLLVKSRKLKQSMGMRKDHSASGKLRKIPVP